MPDEESMPYRRARWLHSSNGEMDREWGRSPNVVRLVEERVTRPNDATLAADKDTFLFFCKEFAAPGRVWDVGAIWIQKPSRQ